MQEKKFLCSDNIVNKKKRYKDGLKSFVTVIININDKIINES